MKSKPMKNLKLLFIVACVILVGACSKKNNSPNPNNGLNSDTVSYSPYYFKFTFGDTVHNFSRYDTLYPGYSDIEKAGGQQTHELSPWPNIQLELFWNKFFTSNTTDTLNEADILSLQGQTLRFNDTANNLYATILYQKKASDDTTWVSSRTVDNSYYIHFDTVRFVKTDNTTFTGIPVKVYLATGTCNALMTKASIATKTLTNGSFRLFITHRY